MSTHQHEEFHYPDSGVDQEAIADKFGEYVHASFKTSRGIDIWPEGGFDDTFTDIKSPESLP